MPAATRPNVVCNSKQVDDVIVEDGGEMTRKGDEGGVSEIDDTQHVLRRKNMARRECRDQCVGDNVLMLTSAREDLATQLALDLRICCESADWLIPRCSAARPKCSSSVAATMYRRCRISIMPFISGSNHRRGSVLLDIISCSP